MSKNSDPKDKNTGRDIVAVEGNIMEMPFFTTQDRRPLTKEITIWLTSERGIRITPPPSGMPDSFDAAIFLYLLWKATKEWHRTGIFPEKVHFTIGELSDTFGTRNRERIRMGVRRLVTTTYEFLESFRRGGIYIDNVVRLIDKVSFWTKESELPKRRARETTYVVFSREIIDSIVSGYYRYLDFQKHQKLKKPLAKRLHFLLAKRLGENREIQIGFVKLARAIPLQTYTEHRKRKVALKYLFAALEELVKAKILTYEYDKKRDVFIFRQPGAKLASMDARDEIRNYLIGELRALWLPDPMINQLLDEKDWDLIAGALEYIDKQKPQNSAGFFLKIVDEGSLPEALKNWSKKRTLEMVNQGRSALFQEDREFVEKFLENFKESFPDLKEGFLKNRFLRYKFEKAQKERQLHREKEEERIDPKEARKMIQEAIEQLKRG